MHHILYTVVYATAVIMCRIAWYIRKRERIDLLNFINPERVADRAGLARFSGSILYLMAALLVAAGLVGQFGLLDHQTIGICLAGALLVLVAWLILGSQDYMKP